MLVAVAVALNWGCPWPDFGFRVPGFCVWGCGAWELQDLRLTPWVRRQLHLAWELPSKKPQERGS